MALIFCILLRYPKVTPCVPKMAAKLTSLIIYIRQFSYIGLPPSGCFWNNYCSHYHKIKHFLHNILMLSSPYSILHDGKLHSAHPVLSAMDKLCLHYNTRYKFPHDHDCWFIPLSADMKKTNTWLTVYSWLDTASSAGNWLYYNLIDKLSILIPINHLLHYPSTCKSIFY